MARLDKAIAGNAARPASAAAADAPKPPTLRDELRALQMATAAHVSESARPVKILQRTFLD